MGVIMKKRDTVVRATIFLLILFIGISFPSFGQEAEEVEITGTVTDTNTGETIPGVNILLKGTTTGTSSNSEGIYSLEVTSLQDTLVFSFIGYQTQETPVNGRTEVNISLQPQAISGDEVVVVGYGEQSRTTATSSVATVSGEDITKVPAANIGNTLFGTSGLQVSQTGGLPGADQPNILVRGISSLSEGRSQPLFVLDDVVMRDASSIMQLDPDNIASVSVLKDASATAIYGMEGANGVILVTTKRGRRGDMKLSVNTSAGVQTPTILPENTDSYTYAQAFNEAQLTDGVAPAQLRFPPETIEAFRTGSNPLLYPDIDWLDYLTKPAALQSRTNISVSGGTGNVRYYVAGGYLKQDGLMEDFYADGAEYRSNPTYDRFNLRSNLDIDVTPSTQLSVNASGQVSSRRRLLNMDWWRLNMSQPFGSGGIVDGKIIATGDRYFSGPIGFPLSNLFGNGYDDINRNVLNLQLSGIQKLDAITEGLQLQLKGAYNMYYTRQLRRSINLPTYTPYYRSDVDPTTPGDSTIVFQKNGHVGPLQYDESYGKDRDWYLEARLQYNRDFGRHSIKGLLLAGQRKQYYPDSYRGIPRQLINTVGRVNYNYDDRYLLELSMGYNGSENFAEDQQFGFFPAVSGGWILTNEPYMPELSFLNFLKLRASYGIVGNDQGIGRFLYLSNEYEISCGGYNFGHEVPENQPAACAGALGNPRITWETGRKQNYGIDLRLFGDRLDLSFDYFYEFRDDILTNLNTVPSHVPVELPAVNYGQVENRGYEAEITWRQQVDDFFYSIGGNVSYARNKILEMDEVPRNEPYQRRTGQSVGQLFGYKFDGFYSDEDFVEGTLTENLTGGVLKEDLSQPSWNVMPGFLKFKDLNGDGLVNEDDQAPIGYPTSRTGGYDYPGYSFGANLNFGYKNLDLATKWAAATRVNELLHQAPNRVPFGGSGNAALRQWQADGQWTPEKSPDEILYPRLSLERGGARNQRDSDFWLIDASYIRLKSVEIGYTLNRLAQGLGIRNMRIYLNAYNPFTFSHMMDTYSIDPEQGGYRQELKYPIMKVYTAGVKIDF